MKMRADCGQASQARATKAEHEGRQKQHQSMWTHERQRTKNMASQQQEKQRESNDQLTMVNDNQLNVKQSNE